MVKKQCNAKSVSIGTTFVLYVHVYIRVILKHVAKFFYFLSSQVWVWFWLPKKICVSKFRKIEAVHMLVKTKLLSLSSWREFPWKVEKLIIYNLNRCKLWFLFKLKFLMAALALQLSAWFFIAVNKTEKVTWIFHFLTFCLMLIIWKILKGAR